MNSLSRIVATRASILVPRAAGVASSRLFSIGKDISHKVSTVLICFGVFTRGSDAVGIIDTYI